jgi:steroid 5-alpha reductase family enzyme
VLTDLWPVLFAGLVSAVLLQIATFFHALRVRRFNVVDITWGLSFVFIVAVGWLISHDGPGDPGRRGLIVVLTSV